MRFCSECGVIFRTGAKYGKVCYDCTIYKNNKLNFLKKYEEEKNK